MIDRLVQCSKTAQRDVGSVTERRSSSDIGVLTDVTLLPYRSSLSSSSREVQVSVSTRTVGAQISTQPVALRPEWRF